jgi:hypothetical protein
MAFGLSFCHSKGCTLLYKHNKQVGTTRALHVSNPFFLFVPVFSSLSLSFPLCLCLCPGCYCQLLSFFLSFCRSAPPTAYMPSLSLSLFLRLKICALLDFYYIDDSFQPKIFFEGKIQKKNCLSPDLSCAPCIFSAFLQEETTINGEDK